MLEHYTLILYIRQANMTYQLLYGPDVVRFSQQNHQKRLVNDICLGHGIMCVSTKIRLLILYSTMNVYKIFSWHRKMCLYIIAQKCVENSVYGI